MRDPWDEYRVRRNVALVAAGGFCPVVFGCAPVLVAVTGARDVALVVAVLVGVGWANFVLASMLRVQDFNCPGYGNRFFQPGRPRQRKPRRGGCPHCGLPKWADLGEYDEEEPS